MKTSNIILVSFLLLLLITPFLVRVALNNKVKSGKYTRIEKDGDRHRQMNTRDDVLQVKGASGQLHCDLLNDGKNYIEYENFNNDSVALNYYGDTLSVNHQAANALNAYEPGFFNITIHTANPELVHVQGASLNLQSAPERIASFRFLLTDHATLALNNKGGSNEPDNDYYENADRDSSVYTDSATALKLNKVEIIAKASEVLLTENLYINTLLLNIDERSSVKLFDRLKFDHADAQIADGAQLKGRWGSIKNLKMFNR